MKKRLVMVSISPAPYTNKSFDLVAQGLGPDSVHTIFWRARDSDGCWRDELPAVCPYTILGERGNVIGRLSKQLEVLDPALVIVGGYRHPAARGALSWCLRTGVPFALRGDSSIWTDRRKGFVRSVVRKLLLGPWLRRASYCMVIGRYNREFWVRYGMKPSQERWWPIWIDYEHFRVARHLRAEAREQCRQEFGLELAINVLYVGRLIRRKRVDLLCQALRHLPEHIGLVIAGRGDEEKRLCARFARMLGSRVRWLGAVEQRDLPKLYAAVDMLVLASGASEPWGLVVNEAVSAGLPILCSRRVGAAGDLLEHGGNGLAVDSGEIAAWSEAIARLASDAGLRERMGQRSIEIADAWQRASDPAICVRALVEPILSAA